jgi:hypothetical protein
VSQTPAIRRFHEQGPTAEIRVIDPGAPHLAFTWQARDARGHQASGQLAGAPPEPEFVGWRYEAFQEAAEAAIQALKELEGLQVADPKPETARRLLCDFCAKQPASYRYPTDHAGMVALGDAMVVLPGSDWLACPACHRLVEAEQWDTLSERALLSAVDGAALWAVFRESRSGPVVPLDLPEGGEVG